MVDLKHQIGRDNPSESGVQMRPREKQKTHEQPLIGASRLGARAMAGNYFRFARQKVRPSSKQMTGSSSTLARKCDSASFTPWL